MQPVRDANTREPRPSAPAIDGRSRPTIRDVAQAAGVSVKTVSRVLNDEPYVRPTTAAQVRSAATRLGFQRHEAADTRFNRDTAHKLVEEANLFIDAAHKCHAKVQAGK